MSMESVRPVFRNRRRAIKRSTRAVLQATAIEPVVRPSFARVATSTCTWTMTDEQAYYFAMEVETRRSSNRVIVASFLRAGTTRGLLAGGRAGSPRGLDGPVSVTTADVPWDSDRNDWESNPALIIHRKARTSTRRTTRSKEHDTLCVVAICHPRRRGRQLI